MLVYTGIYLCLNNFTDFLIDPWWDQNVPLDPGGMCDGWDFHGWKGVLVEMTADVPRTRQRSVEMEI